MDPAYVSALAALAGSAVGAFTSLMTTWLTQRTQSTSSRIAVEMAKREALYGSFIDEASRIVADAIEHQEESPAALVSLFALVSRMRLVSQPEVVTAAERVMDKILDIYAAPNTTFKALRDRLGAEGVDPLRLFGEACRRELQSLSRA